MSRNRNNRQQPQRVAKSADKAKDTNTATVSEADTIKESLKNVQATANKQTHQATEKTATEKTAASQASDKANDVAKSSDAPAAKVATAKATSTAKAGMKAEPENKTAPHKAKNTAQKQAPQKTTAASKKNEPAKKAQPLTQPQKQKVNYAKSEKKSGGGLGVGLALLLGVAGTGLGAYSFNELRMLKSETSATDIAAQLQGLEAQVSAVKADGVDVLNKQLASVTAQQERLTKAEAALKARVDAVEQMQQGLGKKVENDIDAALKQRMGAVETLLSKVKDIELGQKGLSKNLNEVSTATATVSSVGMQKQEIGYLLRMASYKLTSESDVVGATGLLKIAEDKLIAANEGQTDALVDSIREKLIQLSGVKTVDTNALVAQLREVSAAIVKLSPKMASTAATSTQATSAVDTADSSEDNAAMNTAKGIFNKVTAIVASGVKYTPKDPSKIDVSAETALIEKRLMQADVKSAELAIRSHNKVLLAESVNSLRSALDEFFAADESAAAVTEKLNGIASSELDTTLPDLSGLVKQFEQQSL